MVLIPEGEFIIGSSCWINTQPIKKIYLDEFLIDVYPVTNEQFEKFINVGGYKERELWGEFWDFKEECGWEKPRYWEDKRFGIINPNLPVVGVSWYESYVYAKWTGKNLPTEAQWEKAARGGIWLNGDNKKKVKNLSPARKYTWGDKYIIKNLNCFEHSIYGFDKGKNKGTSFVGDFPESISVYGCYDMLGNVWEWCVDEYNGNIYKSIGSNPCNFNMKRVKDPNSSRVLRGGSWMDEIDKFDISYRARLSARTWNKSIGFRCVKKMNEYTI